MPDTLPAPALPTPVIGHFGLSSDWRLEGWCWSPVAPAARQVVEVTLNGRVVHLCVAVQFNDLLRQSGMGDGRCGFSLSPPAQIGVAGAGEMIVEARERGSRTVLGRVVFHEEEAHLPQMRRLDEADRKIRAGNAAMASSSSTLLDGIGDAMIRFGRGLSYGRGAAMWLNDDGTALLHARAALSRLAPIVEPLSCRPELSLVFLGADWRDVYAAMQHAAAVLVSIAKEFTLVDDGAHPTAALLTTVLNGLRVLRLKEARPAELLNQAARMASGELLCIVDDPRVFVATDIERLMRHNQAVVVGLAAARSSGQRPIGGTLARRQPRLPPSVLLLMKRSDYLQAGGVEESDRGAIDWTGFVDKLVVLGIDVAASAMRNTAHSALGRLAHQGRSA